MGETMFDPSRLRRIPAAATAYSRVRGAVRDRRDRRKLADAQVVLVSFPKSGRTFVRTMLARLFQAEHGLCERELLKFSQVRKASPAVPRLLFTHDGDAMRRPDRIRVNAKLYADRKIALLARHPADTVISRYHHLKYRSEDPARQILAAQPLDQFLWTPKGGIPSVVEFLNQWAAIVRDRGDVHLVRYEDVLASPAKTVGDLARFVGLTPCDLALDDAVSFAKVDNLREREREGYFQSKRFGPGKSGDEQGFKVRSGTAGGYRAKLGADQVERIDRYVAENLDPMFGYGADRPFSA